MANEIYHRTNWGNAVNNIAWGDTYEKFDATNEMFLRSDNYENSNETDKLMAAINPKPSILLTPTAFDNAENTGTVHKSIKSVKPVLTKSDNLIINGNFATDSNWTKGDGWSISNGVASCDGSQTGFSLLTQSGTFNEGQDYEVSFRITSYTSGGICSLGFTGGGSDPNPLTASPIGVGTFTGIVRANGNTAVSIRVNAGGKGPAFVGSIDNVIVKEVTDADFDFQRSTVATRVNSSGNIESVALSIPRIDYTGGTGHILLEPNSTNTATYSNDFTQGDIFNSSADPQVEVAVLTSQQATSPDGTNNAWLLKDNNSGGTGTPNLRYFSTNVTSNDFNTLSVFAKKALNNNFIVLSSIAFDTSGNGNSWFNISNGTIEQTGSNHTAKIEDYGNGWYRCSITFKTTTDTSGAIRIRLSNTNGSSSVPLDGTNGVYLFGLQCEADTTQNYATSYIPTEGSTVTRVSELEVRSIGLSNLINSTEGVLYAEIAALANDGTVRYLALSDGTQNNRVTILYYGLENRIRAIVSSGGTNSMDKNFIVTSVLDFHKIAVVFKENDFSLWIDGFERRTDTSGLTPIGLDTLEFRLSGANNFFGKVKCVAVFEEALSDTELQKLTTI